MTATTTEQRRGPGRPRKVTFQPPEPQATQPTLDGSSPEPDRPTEHNGVPVDREELVYNLPKAPFKISRIFLADGSMAYACRDCLFTADRRGEVMLHRNDAHGAKFGMHHKVKVDIPILKGTPDLVLPPRENGPAPSNPMEMTLGEFLALTPSIAALGDLVEEMQTERDAALAELSAKRHEFREHAQKIAYWEANRDELLALRAWKKKMIARLTSMGFKLNEEDE